MGDSNGSYVQYPCCVFSHNTVQAYSQPIQVYDKPYNIQGVMGSKTRNKYERLKKNNKFKAKNP